MTVLGLATAALLAGCSSGQIAQTAEQHSAVNGASADLGTIAIRDAQLAPPHNRQHYYAYGDDALLQLTIVNTASKDDRLVDVSSPIAKGVRVEGHRLIPGGATLRSGGTAPDQATSGASSTASAAPGTRPSGSARPSGTASTSPSGTARSHGARQLPIGHVNITLTGLKVDHLYSGYTVPVRFTFAHAGHVTVNLPIGVPLDPGPKETNRS